MHRPTTRTGRLEKNRPPQPPSCERCPQQPLCRQAGISGSRVKVARNTSLYRDGDPVDDAIYNIRSGSFKVLGAGDGARATVTGFALPSEVLALAALGAQHHVGSAVALEDSEVCRLPWRPLASHGWLLAPQAVAGGWRSLLTGALRCEQQAALMLRHTEAGPRFASLLLSLSRRHAANGYAPLRFRLSMPRLDIASFIGVSAECISRLIARFTRQGWLAIAGRDVTLHEPAALAALLAGHVHDPERAPDGQSAACLTGHQHKLRRGQHLFHMHDSPRDTVYRLRSGHVKLTHISCDGVKRIVDVRGPGDWLGVSTLGLPAHDAGARGLDDCIVDAIAWQPLATLLAHRPGDAAAFSQALAGDIARQQRTADLLRLPSAHQRVARFLWQLAAPSSPTPHGIPQSFPHTVALPMTRQDIGDYLGLTPATVSRAINQLRRDGVARFRLRAFVLEAPAMLAAAAGMAG